MITSIRLENFKNFANEILHMGPFTVIIGANASGKSNIRDALRFLHGIGRSYTIAEIIGGKHSLDSYSDWLPIRGGINEISRFGSNEFKIEVSITIEQKDIIFSICVSINEMGRFSVLSESLEVSKISDNTEFSYHVDYGIDYGYTDHEQSAYVPPDLRGRMFVRVEHPRLSSRNHLCHLDCRDDQPVLTQLPQIVSDAPHLRDVGVEFCTSLQDVISVFSKMRFLDPLPDRMREPAFPGRTILGDHGENLPTALEEICSDPERESVLADWIRELTPMDVDGFDFPRDPSGRVHLTLREKSGEVVSAYSASDGTLKFLAVLVALLSDLSGFAYIFEELDNGIHPTRIHLLLDLIERQASDTGIQVVTTSHSTELVSMINDVTFQTTSVVARLPHRTDAVIRPAASLPKAQDLRTSQGLGQLFRSGWMEDVLAFTEDSGNGKD